MSEDTGRKPTTQNNGVLQQSSRPTPRVLSQEIFEHEQLLKFFIGLRLLGDARRERYLTYLQHLRDTAEPPKDHTH